MTFLLISKRVLAQVKINETLMSIPTYNMAFYMYVLLQLHAHTHKTPPNGKTKAPLPPNARNRPQNA